jgi:DNA-binding GntR family transcriptional regulator
MPRTARVAVQAERLRDQIYQLIREDLQSGELAPGQRLVEVELAEKYGVSRTPVREALFQLTRAGFVESGERGYAAPVYSEKDVRDRLEVKRVLLPAVAAHLASSASPAQAQRLKRAHEREEAALVNGAHTAFVEANDQFRTAYFGMCENALLAKCALLVEHQFDGSRSRIHRQEENRRLTVEHDGRLVAAVTAHDAEDAAAEVRSFLKFVERYYAEHPPGP